MKAALDTNLLVRYFVNDQPDKAKALARLIEEEGAIVPETVILELEWVLRKSYNLAKAEIAQTLRRLLDIENLDVAHHVEIATAIQWFEAGMDFADALHLAHALQARRMLTLDKNFVRVSRRIPTPTPVELF